MTAIPWLILAISMAFNVGMAIRYRRKSKRSAARVVMINTTPWPAGSQIRLSIGNDDVKVIGGGWPEKWRP